MCVAHREYGGKDPRDVVAQRDEGHVLFTRAGNLPTADDSLRVREEHDLEQQRGRIGWCAGLVVLETRIEVRQIDGVIKQVIQRVLQRFRQQLSRQIHGEQARMRVDVLVARHANTSMKMRSEGK